MIKNASVLVEDTEIALSVDFKPTNDVFVVSISHDNVELSVEEFHPSEFTDFIDDFAYHFSVGLASVYIGNRSTFFRFRSLLKAALKDYTKCDMSLRTGQSLAGST